MKTTEIKRGEFNAYYEISDLKITDSKQRFIY
jgi:hypothetical protein